MEKFWILFWRNVNLAEILLTLGRIFNEISEKFLKNGKEILSTIWRNFL